MITLNHGKQYSKFDYIFNSGVSSMLRIGSSYNSDFLHHPLIQACCDPKDLIGVICHTICRHNRGFDILVFAQRFYRGFWIKSSYLHIAVCIFSLAFMTITARAATFNYYYDSLNRVTNATYFDGSAEKYSYNSAGNRISRVTLAATSLLDTMAPSIPTNLVSTAFIPSQLSIAWNHSYDTGGSGLAGYRIYVNGSFVATTTDTNFSLSGLFPNTQYCLTVAAFDHDGNISTQSISLCLTTPVFQPPYLTPFGFANGHFQIGVTGGTVGPYDVWGSSNLFNWEKETNVLLPLANGNFLPLNLRSNGQYFYRLGWRTNTP
jgi:YD repeat-containing protein